MQRVQQIIERASREGIARLLEALAERRDSTGLLPQIRVPTLVVVGEEGQVSTKAESEQMAASVPLARFRVLGEFLRQLQDEPR